MPSALKSRRLTSGLSTQCNLIRSTAQIRQRNIFGDYYRLLQYGLDPKNRDEMIEIGAKILNVSPAGAKLWWNTQEGFYRAPDGLPMIEGMKKEMDLLKEYGILDTAVDIDQWMDLSFMKAAAAHYRH